MQQFGVNLEKNVWAFGGGGVVDPQRPNQPFAGDGGAKKSRSRRKKKNSHNDVASSSKGEADWDMPVQKNSEFVIAGEIGAGGWENEMKSYLDRDQISMRSKWGTDSGVATTYTNNARVSNQCLKEEEGWELAGNRKPRRNEVAPSNQYGQPHQATGWARGGQSANKSGSASSPAHFWGGDGARSEPLRSSEVAVERNFRRDGPVGGRHKIKAPPSQNGGETKWENMTKIKGKGKSSNGGTKSTNCLDKDNWNWDGQQSGWRNPAVSAEVGPVVKSSDANVSWNNGGTKSNNRLDKDNWNWDGQQSGWRNPVVPAEVGPVVKSSDATVAWNNQGILPKSVGAWQHKSPIGDFRSAHGIRAWDNTMNKVEEPQMLSKLLPTEKHGRLVAESICSVGKAGSGQGSNCAPVHSDRSAIVDDFPSSPYSESVCSDDLDEDTDWVDSEGCDSDASKVSHETRKKDKRLRVFFDTLATLNMDQLNEHDRQWHCPACHGGVGAIDWYRGLQPLLAHANSVRSKKVKLHRNFAKVLEEEIRRCGMSLGQSEEMFGKWKGLHEDSENVNPFIVWPPAIIIQNTRLELDEQDKWIGMGNQELLDLFHQYNVVKARHAYGPQGHRGVGIVLFAESPTGYYDALRLEKHFKDARRGRTNWDHPGKVLFYEGGKRMLYGYMATAEDMEIFNKHSGKSKLKWGLKRLKEAVVEPMRQMDENNQQLNWLKQKVQKQKAQSKTLEETVSMVTRKLRLREEEIRVIRERALEQHEENQKEMDELEYIYKNKIKQLVNHTAKREEELQQKEEDFKQEQIRLVQELEQTHAEIPKKNEIGDDGLKLQQKKMEEEIARKSELIEISLKDSEEYEARKRETLGKHHAKRVEFMRQQYEQMLQFEKDLEKEKIELQESYSHKRQDGE